MPLPTCPRPNFVLRSLSIFSLALLTMFFLTLEASAQTHTPGTFSSTGSMTTSRAYFTATRLNNGKVLIAGGRSQANTANLLNTAELYDPTSGTFSSTGSMNVVRNGHTATLLRDGRVLIAGGKKLADNSQAEIFDPATGAFSLTGSPQSPARQGGVATLLPDGRVLIAGGQVSGQPQSSAEIYDPASGTFALANDTFEKCSGPGAGITVVSNGQVLITGGNNHAPPNGGSETCADTFDPESSAFTQNSATMTTLRDHHSSTLLQNGKVLVAGGEIDNGGNDPCSNVDYHGSAEIYDPRTNSFSTTGTMTDSRYSHTATILPNGQVVVAGGGNSGVADGMFLCSNLPTALPWTDLYDPQKGIFSSTGAMSHGRWQHTATFLTNGLLLVSGGFDSNGNAYGSAELYAPPGTVNIGSPLSGDTVSGNVSIGTEISTGVQWINLYIDGQYLGSSPPFSFNWDSTKAANGPHVISAKAYSGSSQVGPTSSVNVNVANGPVAMLWPQTGATVANKVAISDKTSPSVQWVNFYIDGNWIASSPPATKYWDSTTVSNGAHTVSTKAFGSGGQIGSDSVAVNVSN